MSLPFERLDPPTGGPGGAAVVGRLAEAVGFRLRWATEGAGDAFWSFTPGLDSMTARGLLDHIRGLIVWTEKATGGTPLADPPAGTQAEGIRADILHRCAAIGARLLSEGGDAPGQEWWTYVQGPLADALTHVGQLNSWRRLSGDIAPKPRFRAGTPPGA